MSERSMLARLLDEVDGSTGPVRLDALAQRLGVEPSALGAMLDFWARKGRVAAADFGPASVCRAPVPDCGSHCPPGGGCPFVARLPRSFSVDPAGASRSSLSG